MAEKDQTIELRKPPELDENGLPYPDIEDRNKRLREIRNDREADRVLSIEQAFGELQEGHKVSVWRTKPLWCKGHIETIEVDLDDDGHPDVTLEDIREMYGGGSFKLKFLNCRGEYLFQKSVSFAAPPKMDGIVLKSPAEKEREAQYELEQKRIEASNKENHNASNTQVMELIKALVSSDNKSASKANDLVDKMMAQQAALNAERISFLTDTLNKSHPAPMTQLTDMIQTMNQLKEIMGHSEPTEKNDDMTRMLGGLFEIMKNGNLGPQKSPEQSALQQRPVTRRKVSMPNSSHYAPQNNVHPQYLRQDIPDRHENTQNTVAQRTIALDNNTNTEKPAEPVTSESLIERLSEMDARGLAEIVSEVLGSMPDEKQAEVFRNFEEIGNGGEPND